MPPKLFFSPASLITGVIWETLDPPHERVFGRLAETAGDVEKLRGESA